MAEVVHEEQQGWIIATTCRLNQGPEMLSTQDQVIPSNTSRTSANCPSCMASTFLVRPLWGPLPTSWFPASVHSPQRPPRPQLPQRPLRRQCRCWRWCHHRISSLDDVMPPGSACASVAAIDAAVSLATAQICPHQIQRRHTFSKQIEDPHRGRCSGEDDVDPAVWGWDAEDRRQCRHRGPSRGLPHRSWRWRWGNGGGRGVGTVAA